MRAPDLFDYVVGYRTFLIDQATLELRGKFSTAHWRPGTNTARCAPESFYWAVNPAPEAHTAPLKECCCGFHAYYEVEQLLQTSIGVHAVVACWGEVVPHRDGFRAQHAEIRALSDPLGRGTASAVAEKYGVPLHRWVEDLTRVDAGSSLPQHLRGT